MSERVELKGSDGLIYGEFIDGVLVIASRQSRKWRTTQYQRWDLATGKLVTGDVPRHQCPDSRSDHNHTNRDQHESP